MFVLPACATKGYVNQQITGVNGKVESLTKTVEETQERTKANEGKINVVDQKAGAAQGSADAARKAAADADARAGAADAKAVGRRRGVAQARLFRDAVGGPGRLRQSASGSCRTPRRPASTNWSAASRPTARTSTSRSKGHTDSTGPKALNDKLGLERAEAAMKYLRDQHQIPLHKISVISYGPDKPVAPNKTKVDRAQNRRIVINVLS